jgi:nitric oxide reductase NorE protein
LDLGTSLSAIFEKRDHWTVRTDTLAPHDRPAVWIPAEPGLWVLVFGDLFVFALFFGTFAYYRLQEPATFHASQAALNLGFGLLNAVLLLTSSWFVAEAVRGARTGGEAMARRWSLAGMVLGGGFVAVKILEYGEKLRAGLTPATNDFFMLYFVFTGIHLLHVVIGLAALAFLRSRLTKPSSAARNSMIEGCAIFWHTVDVLWVMLFAILYLHQ